MGVCNMLGTRFWGGRAWLRPSGESGWGKERVLSNVRFVSR